MNQLELNAMVTEEEWEVLFTTKNKEGKRERIYTNMLVKLALMEPGILKKLTEGSSKSKRFKVNSTTNAWITMYRLLGGVFWHQMNEEVLIVYKQSIKKIEKERARYSNKDKDLDMLESDGEEKLLERLHIIQLAKTETTKRPYPWQGGKLLKSQRQPKKIMEKE